MLMIDIVMALIGLLIRTDDIEIIMCHIQVPEPSNKMEKTGICCKSKSVIEVGAKKPP